MTSHLQDMILCKTWNTSCTQDIIFWLDSTWLEGTKLLDFLEHKKWSFIWTSHIAAIITHSKQKPCQDKSLFFSNSRNLWWQGLALCSNHQTLSTAAHESHCFHAPTGFIVVSCVSVSSCFESLHALDLRFGRTRRTPLPRVSKLCMTSNEDIIEPRRLCRRSLAFKDEHMLDRRFGH